MSLSIQDVGDDSAPQEPAPGEKSTKKTTRSTTRRRGGRKSKTAIINETRDELDALLKFVAMLWTHVDDVCGPALSQASDQIAEDIAQLAGSSDTARRYLERTLGLGRVMPLLMHTMPLLMTIRQHHLPHRNDTEHDGSGPVA